jgi:hypothetical protein
MLRDSSVGIFGTSLAFGRSPSRFFQGRPWPLGADPPQPTDDGPDSYRDGSAPCKQDANAERVIQID